MINEWSPVKLLRKGRNRLLRKTLILMYHRVIDLEHDSFKLAVSTQHFLEHMEVLNRYFNPISLTQLAATLKEGKELVRNSVVITFDDGYADNFIYAKPILERTDVPATIFVAANHLGKEVEFWWDRLERMMLEPAQLPDSLTLSLGNELFEWKNDSVNEEYINSVDNDTVWTFYSSGNVEPRHALFRKLYSKLRLVSDHERQECLHYLKQWSGAGNKARTSYLSMSHNQIQEAALGGLIEIGSHTMNHHNLAALTRDEQFSEIVDSRKVLQDLTGKDVTTFSYPFGYRGEHYTEETVEIVKSAGYSCACSGFPGWTLKKTDLFQLPRHVVFDWDAETFEKQIKQWFVA